MQILLNPTQIIKSEIIHLFHNDPIFKDKFKAIIDPIVRVSDPRFGDFQANGLLPFAKQNRLNPFEFANIVTDKLRSKEYQCSKYFKMTVAKQGFINFTLNENYIIKWLELFSSREKISKEISRRNSSETVVIDFPSANTAKQPHIGHLRPMNIGESIARILEFSGAKLIRDNHIGDWGTNFGSIIMMLKNESVDLKKEKNENAALEKIDQLYKKANFLEKSDPLIRDKSREELVKLQNNDATNTEIWKAIVDVSNKAFDKIFKELDVKVDITLGESFYKDKVNRIYQELLELNIAEESEGALVVWHNEVKKFSKNNSRPFPFNIRKKDGASNYASTDLATILYRKEKFNAKTIIYLTDARQQDHFQQLFLTTKKWFLKKSYSLPELKHIWWGTILGSDNKPLKTKSGNSLKLQDLIDEAIQRANKILLKKSPNLDNKEKAAIAKAVGIGAIKYADLSSNRTQDYVFDWERMLSFEGNTAPYLLYAYARINSILKKVDLEKPDSLDYSYTLNEDELILAKKLIQFPTAFNQSLKDLRPHFLCTYLYELSGVFNAFYSKNKVIHEKIDIQKKRLMLCRRTKLILKIGLDLIGIKTVERM